MDNRIIKKTILLDANRMVADGKGDGIALLYDEKNHCYYQTTITHIVGMVTRKFEELKAEEEKRFSSLSSELKAEQKKFIRDATETNDALIKLVKGGTGNE